MWKQGFIFRRLVSLPTRRVHHSAQEHLQGRSLVRVLGKDASPFLQGLMTNDIRHLDDNESMYCSFLNFQGRVLQDALLYSDPGGGYLIECDSGSQLVKHLIAYRVRRKVKIDVDESLKTLVLYDKPNIIPEDAFILAKDPRTKELGWRLIVPQEVQVEGLVPLERYRELRYRLGIGEGIEDIPPGTCFPLESNLDYLHGVSFHKGCYIGQELTARTHHTGVVRKRLMPIIFQSTPNGEETTVVNETGSTVGKVRGIIPGSLYGLALLRVQQALSSTKLSVGENPVTTHRPSWWPIEAPKSV